MITTRAPDGANKNQYYFNKVSEIIHLIIAYFNTIHTNIYSNILDLLNNTLPCQIFLTNVFEVIATYCCLVGLLTDRGKLFTFVAGSHHHLSLPFLPSWTSSSLPLQSPPGVAFVLGGLIILMGLVVYISTFKVFDRFSIKVSCIIIKRISYQIKPIVFTSTHKH